jgi:hypothetical protein
MMMSLMKKGHGQCPTRATAGAVFVVPVGACVRVDLRGMHRIGRAGLDPSEAALHGAVRRPRSLRRPVEGRSRRGRSDGAKLLPIAYEHCFCFSKWTFARLGTPAR